MQHATRGDFEAACRGDASASLRAHLSSCPRCALLLCGFTRELGAARDEGTVDACDGMCARMGDIERLAWGTYDPHEALELLLHLRACEACARYVDFLAEDDAGVAARLDEARASVDCELNRRRLTKLRAVAFLRPAYRDARAASMAADAGRTYEYEGTYRAPDGGDVAYRLTYTPACVVFAIDRTGVDPDVVVIRAGRTVHLAWTRRTATELMIHYDHMDGATLIQLEYDGEGRVLVALPYERVQRMNAKEDGRKRAKARGPGRDAGDEA